MIKYLLSDLYSELPINNEIIEMLKEDLKQIKKMVAITSTPDHYQITDLYYYGDDINPGVMKTFKELNNQIDITLIDRRMSLEEAQSLIMETDAVLLMGGDAIKQMVYLDELAFTHLIKNQKVIIGVSAGAINMGKMNLALPKENEGASIMYEGLNYFDFSIIPHFNIEDEWMVYEVFKASLNANLIGLPNHSGIRQTRSNLTYFGDQYLFIKQSLMLINRDYQS